MCSIAGGRVGVRKMLETMRHRSPDGMRVWKDKFYEIGMGRLAIIDRENDRFPFYLDKYILTFNGEIYNYIELRDELKSLGHTFETNGDTEVLLRSYMQWGEACLDKLNAMFAFAIYDCEKHTIFFARDIAGEKPFYYKLDPFRFASEAKALRLKCQELPPAHCGTFDLVTKKLEVRRWWTFTPRKIDLENAEQELEWLLEDSIRLRTRSHVPYALYLSDGIDSNLIHSFKPETGAWSTFTYVDKLHSAEDYKKVAKQIVWHLDYPIDSFSPYGLWSLAERASKDGFKVVLSGEGADELFGGYIRYVPNALNYEARKRFPSYQGMFPYKGDLGWKDFNGRMRELLRQGDRMASAWGIENRCPFLDRRIIEFAFSLPPELKAFGFDTKIILKRILKRRKPDFVEKEKHGLYCSVNSWLESNELFTKNTYMAYQQSLWRMFQS